MFHFHQMLLARQGILLHRPPSYAVRVSRIMAEEGGVYNRQQAYRRSTRAAEDHYGSMEEGEGAETTHV